MDRHQCLQWICHFLEDLPLLLKKYFCKYAKIDVMGDFNIDLKDNFS